MNLRISLMYHSLLWDIELIIWGCSMNSDADDTAYEIKGVYHNFWGR